MVPHSLHDGASPMSAAAAWFNSAVVATVISRLIVVTDAAGIMSGVVWRGASVPERNVGSVLAGPRPESGWLASVRSVDVLSSLHEASSLSAVVAAGLAGAFASRYPSTNSIPIQRKM